MSCCGNPPAGRGASGAKRALRLSGSGSRPAFSAPSMAVASSASLLCSWARARRVTVSRQASRWVSRSGALSKQRRHRSSPTGRRTQAASNQAGNLNERSTHSRDNGTNQELSTPPNITGPKRTCCRPGTICLDRFEPTSKGNYSVAFRAQAMHCSSITHGTHP